MTLGMTVGVITFPGTLDDVDAVRAVRLAGGEAVNLWHADHDLRGERSLARRVGLETIVAEDDVQWSMTHPPTTTRAYFRGRCLQKWPNDIVAANWDSMVFDIGRDPLRRVPMMEPLKGTAEHVGTLLDELERAGLRGRGGAGFPSARKWRTVASGGPALGDPGSRSHRRRAAGGQEPARDRLHPRHVRRARERSRHSGTAVVPL